MQEQLTIVLFLHINIKEYYFCMSCMHVQDLSTPANTWQVPGSNPDVLGQAVGFNLFKRLLVAFGS